MAKQSTEAVVAGALGVSAAGLILGALGAVAVGSAFARLVVTPASRPEERVRVEAVAREGESDVVQMRGPDVDLPGSYSFIFDGGSGHARMGQVIRSCGGSVVRRIEKVDRGTLRAGARGRVTGWWYTSPAELGLEWERVSYPTELGDAEAWLIRPRRSRKRRWAVHVHGRGARPEETLRGVLPLARAGITSLVITYRNDAGAPAGAYGRYGVGVSESRDVDAAIAEAQRRGAERVTLVGWSMGGTATLIAATRGVHQRVIDGLILDSPAIDWPGLLRHQAAGRRMPKTITDIGLGMLGRGMVRGGERGGIPLAALTPERFARELTVPVLIHAGRRDTFVPPGPARRLAELRPDLVQLRLQPVGEHVKLWNVDRDPWERVTEAFARALPRPPWRG